jgi:membrane protein YqaA with SNARE-associated domain
VLHFAHHRHATTALFALSFAESSFFPVPPDVLLMPLVLGHRARWLRYAVTCSLASVLGAVFGFLIGAFLWGQVGAFFHDHVPGFARDRVALADGREVHGLVDRRSIALTGPFAAEPTYPVTLDGNDRRFDRDQLAADGVTIRPFSKVGKMYEQYNFWIVFTAGFTPIPFKVITITAGVFGTGEEVASPWLFFAVFLLAGVVSRSARFFLVAGLMRAAGPKVLPFIDRYFNWLALLFTALLIGGFVAIKYVF